MKNLGALQQCEHISISNGSQIGNNQGYEPGALLLSMQGDLSDMLEQCAGQSSAQAEFIEYLAGVFGTGGAVSFGVWALPSFGIQQVIYVGSIVGVVVGIPVSYSSQGLQTTGITQPLDNAPGGSTIIPGGAISVCSLLQIPQDRFCFIPAVSAIEVGPLNGLNNPLSDPFLDISDNAAVLASGQTTVDRYMAWDNTIPTGAPPSAFNQAHLAFSTDNTATLLYELRGIEVPLNP